MLWTYQIVSLYITGDAIGDICPSGSYCPEGTDEPIECPAGTFNPDMGRMSVSECLDCTGGYHCNTTGKAITVTLLVRLSL